MWCLNVRERSDDWRARTGRSSCVRTLKCPHGHQWCNVINSTIFLGDYLFFQIHKEVVCDITKNWSEVTNPPGDHLLANGRTDSLPVFTIPINRHRGYMQFHLNPYSNIFSTYAKIIGDGQLFIVCNSVTMRLRRALREGYCPSALNIASVASGPFANTIHLLSKPVYNQVST